MLNVRQDISQNKGNFLVNVNIWIIKNIYRKHIKPYRKRKKNILCGFYPDCSEYGILALKKHGFLFGWIKISKRISKCNTYKHKGSCIDFP